MLGNIGEEIETQQISGESDVEELKYVASLRVLLDLVQQGWVMDIRDITEMVWQRRMSILICHSYWLLIKPTQKFVMKSIGIWQDSRRFFRTRHINMIRM